MFAQFGIGRTRKKNMSLFDSLKSVKMANGAAQHLADDALAKAGNAETCR